MEVQGWREQPGCSLTQHFVWLWCALTWRSPEKAARPPLLKGNLSRSEEVPQEDLGEVDGESSQWVDVEQGSQGRDDPNPCQASG